MRFRKASRLGGPSLVLAAALALVGLLVYGQLTTGASTTLTDAVSRGERPTAPSRPLPKLGGGETALADFRGRPVILNFWASWCDPCKEEAPLLVRAHELLTRSGGTVLGVTVKDATGDSQTFVDKFRLPFPNVRDVGDELGDDYGLTGVPETYAIDRSGRVVALSRGQITQKWVDDAVRTITPP